jgi:hypothetical protein
MGVRIIRKKSSVILPIFLVIVIFSLSACTQEKPAIIGTLEPWSENTIIANRRLALCKTSSYGSNCACTLINLTITSDEQGGFVVEDILPGEYMIIYESYKSDFNAGLEKWGGTDLNTCDPVWAENYFENYADGWTPIHMPEGFKIDQEKIWLYVQFSLAYGLSPFIVAHVLGEAYPDERVLEPIIVKVVEGETSQVIVPVF